MIHTCSHYTAPTVPAAVQSVELLTKLQLPPPRPPHSPTWPPPCTPRPPLACNTAPTPKQSYTKAAASALAAPAVAPVALKAPTPPSKKAGNEGYESHHMFPQHIETTEHQPTLGCTHHL